MLLFGGDIICESQFGGIDKFGNEVSGWTKFSLLFPLVSKDVLMNNDQKELENNQNSHEKGSHFKSSVGSQVLTKILLIGDQNKDIGIIKNKINY